MNLPVFLLLFSIGALGGAYTAQYGFGMDPCILCLYQRYPYFIVIVLSAISLMVKGRARLALVFLCALALIAGSFIAFYHLGVEQGKWQMETECSDTAAIPSTLEEMTQQIMGATTVPCDQPQFVFLGLSMAAWNMIFSGFFGWISFFMCYNSFKMLRDMGRTDKYRKEQEKIKEVESDRE